MATLKVTTPKMKELIASCEIPLIMWPLVQPPARRAPNSSSPADEAGGVALGPRRAELGYPHGGHRALVRLRLPRAQQRRGHAAADDHAEHQHPAVAETPAILFAVLRQVGVALGKLRRHLVCDHGVGHHEL
jgi:hypothetical protein